ncbi:MAG: Wzy polymerase domain-containing protein [Candidatus Bipolaricaulota bacterium]|nr:Wzy polymerase domain-containing protein [Candidatus Bipolaricaulota bacterium]
MHDRYGAVRVHCIARALARRLDFGLLMLVVFVLPLFFWPGATEYNYARCIFLVIAVSLLTIVHLAGTLRRGEDHLTIPWIVLPLLGLIAAALLSLLHATNARVGVESLVVALAFSQFAFLTVNAVRERRDATLLLSALFASACVVAVHALLQYCGILPGTASPGSGSMITTLGNPDIVAGFLACCLLPSTLLINRARRRLPKVAICLGIGAILATILLTGQAGVLVGLVAALIAILLGWTAFRPRSNRRVPPLVLFFVAIGLVLAMAFALQTPLARLWKANSGTARSTFWSVGWTMFKGNPVTGVGLGNFKIVYPKYEAITFARPGAVPPSGYVAKPAQAHNDYLQAAAELGSVGILAVLGLLSVLAVSLWKRLRANAPHIRSDVLVLLGGLVVFLCHALVGFPIHWAAPSLAALLLVALALSPAYGTSALFSVRLGRQAVHVALVVAALSGLTVSVLAARDLAANVLQLRGTRLLEMGHDQAALETLQRSIALDFSPRQSYLFLASAQYKLGEYSVALDSLAMCFTRSPNESLYLMYADLAAGLGQLDRGVQVLDFLLTTYPSPANADKARYIRALIQREKGDPVASAAALRDLIADTPEYEQSYIALGEIRAAAGDTGEARSLFEKALALIEDALPPARVAATVTESTTFSTYTEARDRIEDLTREREAVLRNLAALAADSP